MSAQVEPEPQPDLLDVIAEFYAAEREHQAEPSPPDLEPEAEV